MSVKTEFCPKCEKNSRYSYEEIEEIANYLMERVSIKPQIGLICGTGLGPIGDILSNTRAYEYKDIPKFPVSTVQSHAGKLLFGYIAKIPVVCMQGRLHHYEGYTLSQCTMPVRLMKMLGVTILIVSNAAGGITSTYKAGDIMLIKDHINFIGFSGNSPLRGPNDERFGPRFPAMNDAYDQKFLKEAKEVVKKLCLQGFHEGVYGCVGGPCFETVAEVKALKILGVDAVGMSTVHEVMVARHCGMTCLGFSLITNVCVVEYDAENKPAHEAIMAVATSREKDLQVFLENLVPQLAKVHGH